MMIRQVDVTDAERLLAFVGSIPEADRAFFKEHAPPQDLVRRWGQDEALRFASFDGDEILGMVSVRPGAGASSHVGEVTLLVLPEQRRRGVGKALAKEALLRSVSEGLTHIFVEVSAEEVGTRHMFEQFGFMPEALLRDFIRDSNGDHHDLIVMTHCVEEHWAENEALGLGTEI